MGTPTKFDPAAIKLECERMMAVLRQERSSEEELADASEVDREIERLKREVWHSSSRSSFFPSDLFKAFVISLSQLLTFAFDFCPLFFIAFSP